MAALQAQAFNAPATPEAAVARLHAHQDVFQRVADLSLKEINNLRAKRINQWIKDIWPRFTHEVC